MTYVGNEWTQLAYWEEPTGYYNYVAQLRLIAWSSQNIETNQSTIHWQWQKSVTGGSVYWNDSHGYSVSCGTSTSWDFALGSQSSTAWTNVGDEHTTTVTHNSDGSRSVGWSCSGYKYWSYVEASGTIELPTIPRASVPTVAPSTVLLSEAQNTITVNTNRKSSSFTHTLALTIGNHTETQTAVSTSTDFSIPKTVLADFASNSLTLEGSIVCTTYNGSTQIGSAQTIHFTAQIDTSQEHPAIGSISLSDTNPASAAIETSGTFIKNASNLRAVISLSAVGSYTELASAVVQCGNTQQTYALSGTSQTITFNYNKLDANSLVVTVYDERGTSRVSTRNWTLVPYRDLTVTGSVDRTSETGSTIAFTLNGDCFAGSFGNTTNTITVDYEWKLSSESDFHTVSNAFTFTPSGSGETQFTYSNTLTGFDYDKQYNLRFTVKDMFTSATTRVLTLTVGIPVWAYGEDWFGVYGNQYLHFDRDNPNKFWDLKEGLDAILQYHADTNLMNITIATQTVGGITYTVDDDGTITANGTATEDSTLKVGVSKQLDTSKTWYFSGCPSGGSSSTYYCGWETMSSPAGTIVFAADTGTGCELIPYDGYPAYCPFYIVIKSGTIVSNLTFKPMIRDIRIASDVFVPQYSPIRYDTSGIWFRVQIGKLLILLCTNSTGGQLQFGVTFDSVPFVLTGASQGSYGHGTTNQQIWDLTTSSMRWDAYYGSSTKYPASLMVIGLYSGQI